MAEDIRNQQNSGAETPWEHPFHEKFLTLNFAGYLIRNGQGFDGAEFLRRHEKDFADNFENLVKEFDNFIDPDKIHKFYQLVPNQDEKQREYYEKVYRKYWSIEMERYKCLSKPNEAGKDTLNEAESEKGTNKMDLINSFKFFTTEALKKYTDEGVGEIPEKDIKHLVDKIMRRGFKFLFGRSDHRLVASLVKAIWDMKKEGDWKIAYVPREQLLSVDMEKRSVRELTLQLYPHKPVYKRREKDEIRGWEEVFPDGMPWCMAPGGRALPEIIDGFNGIDYDYTIYKELCGSEDRPKTLFTEDVWSMNERKRLFKEERKKEVEKSVLKVNDARVQVNHFLPILKEVTGFRGRIRDEDFYNGFQGLIYIVQVQEKEDTVSELDKEPHLKSLIASELAFRREKKRKERKDREEKLRKEEETDEKSLSK